MGALVPAIKGKLSGTTTEARTSQWKSTPLFAFFDYR
jgi:hypothetical protein